MIARNLLESIELMANVSRLLADKAIASFKVNESKLKEALARNPTSGHGAEPDSSATSRPLKSPRPLTSRAVRSSTWRWSTPTYRVTSWKRYWTRKNSPPVVSDTESRPKRQRWPRWSSRNPCLRNSLICPHTLPALPYAYAALEPHIDAQTMEIHHTKHHQTYVTGLNAAIEGTEWAEWPVEKLLGAVGQLPEKPAWYGDQPWRRARPTTACSGP
ncbi:superoxide dismutase [Pseudomonas putida S11]|nr:superoxide dismutase [Pseudomonas putida S11]